MTVWGSIIIDAYRDDEQELQTRVGTDGISVRNLREPKRGLAEEINRLTSGCGTLSGSFAAAQAIARVACRDQPTRLISWDALHVIRQALVAPAGLGDGEAREKAAARLLQLRMVSAGHERRGISLLTCHEGKG